MSRHESLSPPLCWTVQPLENWTWCPVYTAGFGEAFVGRLVAARIEGDPPPESGLAELCEESDLVDAARYRSAEARRRLLMRRSLLRAVVAGHLGCRPREVRVTRDALGNPRVQDHPSVEISCSTSKSVALVGLAENRAIGVDVEAIAPFPDLDLVAQYFLTAKEAAGLLDLDGDSRLERFLRLWTLKEALLKAAGTGLRMNVDHFEIDLDRPHPVAAVAGDAALATAWHGRSLTPMPGFVAAVGWCGHETRRRSLSPAELRSNSLTFSRS